MKKLWVIPFLFIAINSYADAPSRQITYVDSTTIRSQDVTKNEDEIFQYLQVGVDTIRDSGLDAITEVKSTIRSGSDQTLVTGTKGTADEFCVWNSDGDAIGASGFSMTGVAVRISGTVRVDSLVTGTDTGIDLCIDTNNKLCTCGNCE